MERTSKAKSDEERLHFDLGLMTVFARAESYEQLSVVGSRVFESYPQSDLAFSMLTISLQKQGLWGEFDRLVDRHLNESPDAVVAIRAKVTGALQRGDLDTVIALTERLRQQGHMTSNDLNNRAWSAIVAVRIDKDAVEAIEQAILLGQNDPSPHRFHTQAAIYAETGRPADARQVLLQYLLRAGLAEPDPGTWYVLGRLAEAYGELEAARDYYERVERPKNPNDIADSSYAIAQRKLSRLEGN